MSASLYYILFLILTSGVKSKKYEVTEYHDLVSGLSRYLYIYLMMHSTHFLLTVMLVTVSNKTTFCC